MRADPIRLIDEKGEQVGVVSRAEALRRAESAGLDLVEVAETAKPPVCKILDYGKFKYQEQKRAAEARKKQTTIVVKEIPLRPRTEDHDLQIKLRKAREFLEAGNKVKFNLRFRGREVMNQELALGLLTKVEESLAELGKVEHRPKLEGRFLSMTVGPKK